MATNAALRLHAQSARFRALPVVLFYQLSLVAYLILSLWISDGFVFTDTFLNLLTFQKASNSMASMKTRCNSSLDARSAIELPWGRSKVARCSRCRRCQR